MKLKDILKDIECEIVGNGDIEISDIKNDSRKVEAGDIFFCISGFEQDGHKYAPSAVEKGAVCLFVTKKLEDINVTQVIVKNDRKAMAIASANFYGHPSREMIMIGITGTNGKTTSTYMIKSIAEKAGYKVGLVGTIKNMIGDRELHTERTTPESIELQKLLREMKDAGCDMVVMEVSSHSLYLDRTYMIDFNVGIFSNLTQDHLDFHETFENYIAAKALLFAQSEISVINADDKSADAMIKAAKGKVITYGCKEKCDVCAENISVDHIKTTYKTVLNGKEEEIFVSIPGMFTVYNSLCAAVGSSAAGIDNEKIVSGLKELKGVDGRFQALPTGGEYTLILDYAHTPDSLLNVLKTIKEIAKNRIITVFGCGGNRDRGKRPLMAKIAAEYSDLTVVTSDNPRFEEPADIIKDIVAGLSEKDNYVTIENRRDAIKYAMETAQEGDIILLAGKGHETYQEIKGVKHDFDEKVVVAQIAEELKNINGDKR